MDPKTSHRPENPWTSFLWGLLAYAVSYFLMRFADLDLSSQHPSTLGMPLHDFSGILIGALTLVLAFTLLCLLLRPSVNWFIFILAGISAAAAGVATLFITNLLISLILPRAINDWLSQTGLLNGILSDVMIYAPFYLGFAAVFSRMVFGKNAVPLFVKLFAFATLGVIFLSNLVFALPLIRSPLVSMFPELESVPSSLQFMIPLLPAFAGSGTALYNHRLNRNPGDPTDASLPRG